MLLWLDASNLFMYQSAVTLSILPIKPTFRTISQEKEPAYTD